MLITPPNKIEQSATPPSRASTADRFEELRSILDTGRYFKIVCAAGNRDAQAVRRLSLVYTLAGAVGIDVSADVDIVKASVAGIDAALDIAPSMRITLPHRPFITVSVGLPGDPHVRKSRILADLCTSCGECYEHCDDRAISDAPHEVDARRCVGCGTCAEVCEFDAIQFHTDPIDLADVLPKCIAAGAENIELHARIPDEAAVQRDWRIVAAAQPDQFISMCVDRGELSNAQLIARITQARQVAGDRLIVQADGVPMSGGSDDFNTTLQTVDCANVVRNSDLDAKILLSGGTNSKTGELAALCDVRVHGVAIGTFARNLVRDETSLPDFESNAGALARAVVKARRLVGANISRLLRL